MTSNEAPKFEPYFRFTQLGLHIPGSSVDMQVDALYISFINIRLPYPILGASELATHKLQQMIIEILKSMTSPLVSAIGPFITPELRHICKSMQLKSLSLI